MEKQVVDAIFILVVGSLLFVVLMVGVIFICASTLRRVNNMKIYCDEQFDKISEQISIANKNTEELTKSVKALNKSLKEAS